MKIEYIIIFTLLSGTFHHISSYRYLKTTFDKNSKDLSGSMTQCEPWFRSFFLYFYQILIHILSLHQFIQSTICVCFHCTYMYLIILYAVNQSDIFNFMFYFVILYIQLEQTAILYIETSEQQINFLTKYLISSSCNNDIQRSDTDMTKIGKYTYQS